MSTLRLISENQMCYLLMQILNITVTVALKIYRKRQITQIHLINSGLNNTHLTCLMYRILQTLT